MCVVKNGREGKRDDRERRIKLEKRKEKGRKEGGLQRFFGVILFLVW